MNEYLLVNSSHPIETESLKKSIEESSRSTKELIDRRDIEIRAVSDQKAAVVAELQETVTELNNVRSRMQEMSAKIDNYDCQLRETQEGDCAEKEALLSKIREIREEVREWECEWAYLLHSVNLLGREEI